jgi:hypothetical protein
LLAQRGDARSGANFISHAEEAAMSAKSDMAGIDSREDQFRFAPIEMP